MGCGERKRGRVEGRGRSGGRIAVRLERKRDRVC